MRTVAIIGCGKYVEGKEGWAIGHAHAQAWLDAFPNVALHGVDISKENLDGFWQTPYGAVTVRQNHGFGWYVMKDGFSYIATGPSALGELDVSKGQGFDETFEVIVEDR